MNAESALLGALMLSNASFWQVADKVSAEDFASEDHARLFAAIATLTKAGKPADAVTIMDHDDSLYGMASSYQSSVPSASGASHYAELVRRDAELRRLKRAGQAIASCESYEAAQGLLAAVRPTQARAVKSVKDGIEEMVDALQRRYDADGGLSGVPTGLASLDLLTSGFQPGNLVIVAARPGMGKSAFALQHAIAAGRTFYSSLEMTAGELVERAVASTGNFPHRWLRFPADAPDNPFDLARWSGTTLDENGDPLQSFSPLLHMISRKVSRLPLLIDDSAGLTADAITSRIRQAHMANPLSSVVIDHLGLIARAGKHDPSELGLITTACKQLGKWGGFPVIVLCQLNRGLEQRPNKRPQLSDLRDSGRIEEDADVVIGLYRDEYYNPEPHNPLAGYLEAIVLKNRSGELGTAWARSRLSCMRLESCDAPERPAVSAQVLDGRTGFQARSTARRQPQAVS